MESRASVVRPASRPFLRISLMGDLRAERGGQGAALPASKRTRALLGFLAATQKPQSRQSLCDLFWEGPDDPRGSLRWSLTKLRPVVNDEGIERLIADREHVSFRAQAADVDTAEIKALLAGGVEAAATRKLETAAELLQGEFLDGLDLPVCYRFHNWCMSERERLGGLRTAVLAQLLTRFEGDPAKALPFARALIAADPLSEAAHAKLTAVLIGLGRPREAEAHAEQASTLLRRELAAPLSGELRKAASQARPSPSRQDPVTPVPVSEPSISARRATAPPLPNSEAIASDAIAEVLTPMAGKGGLPLLLLLAEAGMGKTRRLEDLARRAKASGYRVLSARAFEAEMVRPYGIWIDLLDELAQEDIPEASRSEIASLLLHGDGTQGQGDRTALFAGVGTIFKQVSQSQPLLVTLDDLQWLDDTSCSLLHYLVRTLGPAGGLQFAAAARTGELEDNAAAKRLLQSLKRERCLREWALPALDLEATAALLAEAGSQLDPGFVLRQSEGNPLFALELARAHGRGETVESSSLTSLIAGELARLPERERDVLTFAAAMGRNFRPDVLGSAMEMPELEILSRIEHLERRGLLRVSGGGYYDFVHDLFRQAMYRSLSQAMRRIVHRQIARAFADRVAGEADLQSDLAHHAGLAGDPLAAVRALLSVGDRALRLFAPSEATAAAERAMVILSEIPEGPERIRLHMGLLDVRLRATTSVLAPRLPDLRAELKSVTTAAEAVGLHAEAANGYHLLSWLTQRADELSNTRDATLLAAKYGRAADDRTRCQQLSNTARCLMDVEVNVESVRDLIADADSLADVLSLRITELEWAKGLVARWDGDLAGARDRLADALELARLRQDRWREFELLIWLATVEYELGHFAKVEPRCLEILSVAQKMGDGRSPTATALTSLAAIAGNSPPAESDLANAIVELRAVDDKTHLSFILNELALLRLAAGEMRSAIELAGEACQMAQAIKRSSEVAVSQSILARVEQSAGRVTEATAHMAQYLAADLDPSSLSLRARRHLLQAASDTGLTIPTLIQTLER